MNNESLVLMPFILALIIFIPIYAHMPLLFAKLYSEKAAGAANINNIIISLLNLIIVFCLLFTLTRFANQLGLFSDSEFHYPILAFISAISFFARSNVPRTPRFRMIFSLVITSIYVAISLIGIQYNTFSYSLLILLQIFLCFFANYFVCNLELQFQKTKK